MRNSSSASASTDTANTGLDSRPLKRAASSPDAYDPRPWAVLEHIEVVPLPRTVKAAMRRSHESYCRRFAFPLVRAVAFTVICLGALVRTLLPGRLKSYQGLHACVLGGLCLFALPETKMLILRHFNIGSRILDFLVANMGHGGVANKPQYPASLRELWPNGFMEHDLNLYRVLEGLSTDMAGDGGAPRRARLDFSAIVDVGLEIESFGPRKWWQFLDLHSAVELIVPMYVIFLPASETFRASHSLQLDEIVALHLVKLVGHGPELIFVGNRNPWMPMGLLGTASRLLAHGISTEIAYEMLARLKSAAAAGKPAE